MKHVRLCSRDDMESGSARRFEVAGHLIALIRIENDFYALSDRCSHANVPLSEGEVYPEEKEIECWKHGSTFSLLSGQPQSLPATKPVPVYEVELDGDDVMVKLP